MHLCSPLWGSAYFKNTKQTDTGLNLIFNATLCKWNPTYLSLSVTAGAPASAQGCPGTGRQRESPCWAPGTALPRGRGDTPAPHSPLTPHRPACPLGTLRNSSWSTPCDEQKIKSLLFVSTEPTPVISRAFLYPIDSTGLLKWAFQRGHIQKNGPWRHLLGI